jgi:hypothetical protein
MRGFHYHLMAKSVAILRAPPPAVKRETLYAGFRIERVRITAKTSPTDDESDAMAQKKDGADPA